MSAFHFNRSKSVWRFSWPKPRRPFLFASRFPCTLLDVLMSISLKSLELHLQLTPNMQRHNESPDFKIYVSSPRMHLRAPRLRSEQSTLDLLKGGLFKADCLAWTLRSTHAYLIKPLCNDLVHLKYSDTICPLVSHFPSFFFFLLRRQIWVLRAPVFHYWA